MIRGQLNCCSCCLPAIHQKELGEESASDIIQHSSESGKRGRGEELRKPHSFLLLFTMLSHMMAQPHLKSFAFFAALFSVYQQMQYKLYSRICDKKEAASPLQKVE